MVAHVGSQQQAIPHVRPAAPGRRTLAAYHPAMPGRPVLAIDIGNSNLTATLVRDGAPGEVRRALLARETLDADQVRRIVAGQPLDELSASSESSAPTAREARPKERPSTAIVPPIPPRPLTQE